MIHFIVNPAAGKGKTREIWPGLESRLRREGLKYKAWTTEYPNHATELARQALKEGATTVCGVGGDGVANEIANALAGTDTALALIPTGSGNDFALMLNQRTVEAGLRALQAGKRRAVDIGRAEGRYFVNILGIGFAAMVAASFKRKKLKGNLAYFVSVLDTLVGFRPVRILVDDGTHRFDASAMMVALGNGRSHGGMFLLTPDAEIDDGRFDVCIVRATPVWRFLLSLPRAAKGTHVTEREIEMFQTQDLLISSPEPFFVHLDGELLPYKPESIKVEFHRRHLFVQSL